MQQTVESRFERRKQATRRRLVAAARELFAERGLHETAISQIAERADVGLGTFYLHFDSKDAVLAAIVVEDMALLMRRIEAAVAGVEGVLARHRIATRLYLEHAYANRALVRILFEQVPSAHPVLYEVHTRWVGMTEALLHEGIARGEVCTASVPLLARAIVAIVGQASLSWVTAETPTPAEVAETISTFIERGLPGAPETVPINQ